MRTAGVKVEHPIGQWLADFQHELQRFCGLQGADDAR
jgi:hypothetical protein